MKSIERDIHDKKFDQALNKLNTHKDQISEATYWLNRGYIEKEMGYYPLSRYSLELAKNIAPYNFQIYQELTEVENKLELKDIEVIDTTSDFFHYTVNYLPLSVTLTVFLIIFSISGLLFKMQGATWKWVLFFILGISVPFTQFIYQKQYTVGITNNALQVREGPSKVFAFNQVIPEGVKVVLLQDDGWYKILYPSHFSGWTTEVGVLYRLNGSH